tara:strand:+ start:1153 stop:1524 length:372 start_codon:yes stop_codon:yes gene_type:complete
LANPYYKYLGKEDILQNNVMTYLKLQYPYALFTHIPNEGKRTKFEQFKLKYLGTKPGVPDVMIFTPNKNRNGLAIELKAGYNKPTENQKIWLGLLSNANWSTHWSNDFDECKIIIDKYFNDEI